MTTDECRYSVLVQKPSEIAVENIRKLRRAHGFTAETLAASLSAAGLPINRVGVAKLENGHRVNLYVDELAVFAAVLGVETYQLLRPLAIEIKTSVIAAEPS